MGRERGEKIGFFSHDENLRNISTKSTKCQIIKASVLETNQNKMKIKFEEHDFSAGGGLGT